MCLKYMKCPNISLSCRTSLVMWQPWLSDNAGAVVGAFVATLRAITNELLTSLIVTLCCPSTYDIHTSPNYLVTIQSVKVMHVNHTCTLSICTVRPEYKSWAFTMAQAACEFSLNTEVLQTSWRKYFLSLVLKSRSIEQLHHRSVLDNPSRLWSRPTEGQPDLDVGLRLQEADG